jgi:hypothetical protein
MNGSMRPWHGTLAYEDRFTVDGRRFLPDALRWASSPLPLLSRDDEPFALNTVIGRVDKIWREDYEIKARGVLLKELPFDTELLDDPMILPCGIEAVIEESEQGFAHLTIHKAKLRAVVTCAGYQPAWPDVALHLEPLQQTPEEFKREREGQWLEARPKHYNVLKASRGEDPWE